jgi:hypothetical protein
MFKIFLFVACFDKFICKGVKQPMRQYFVKIPEKLQNSGIVNFKGVSFIYNPEIFLRWSLKKF